MKNEEGELSTIKVAPVVTTSSIDYYTLGNQSIERPVIVAAHKTALAAATTMELGTFEVSQGGPEDDEESEDSKPRVSKMLLEEMDQIADKIHE